MQQTHVSMDRISAVRGRLIRGVPGLYPRRRPPCPLRQSSGAGGGGLAAAEGSWRRAARGLCEGHGG